MQGSGQLRLAGIDGCRSGWIMALGGPTGPLIEVSRFDSLLELKDKADLIAIDMPLGLRQGPPRRADAEARALLGLRRSCVFSVPHRDAVSFSDYREANQWSKTTGFGGISKQAWNIVPKMREAAEAAAAGDHPIWAESHPEMAFKRLAPETVLAPKACALGHSQRRALLQVAGIDPGPFLGAWRRSAVAPDDILDACVLLLTARHIANGSALYVPAHDEVDPSTGRRIRIWY